MSPSLMKCWDIIPVMGKLMEDWPLSHYLAFLLFYYGIVRYILSPSFGGSKKSGGTIAGIWCSSAHCLTASKLRHTCSVLKSTYASGSSAETG
jgi:hypothetical protein